MVDVEKQIGMKGDKTDIKKRMETILNTKKITDSEKIVKKIV